MMTLLSNCSLPLFCSAHTGIMLAISIFHKMLIFPVASTIFAAFVWSITTAQNVITENQAWPQEYGDSLNSGHTIFNGPNMNQDIVDRSFSIQQKGISFCGNPLIGPDGVLIYTLSTFDGENSNKRFLTGYSPGGDEKFQFEYYESNPTAAILVNDMVCVSGSPSLTSDFANSFGLICIDFGGSILWSALNSTTIQTAPIVVGNNVIVCSTSHCYSLTTSKGEIEWTSTLSSYISNEPGVPYPSLSPDGTTFFYCHIADNILSAYSTTDGSLKWEVTLGADKISNPVLSSDGLTIYMNALPSVDATVSKLYALSSEDGTVLWASKAGFECGSLYEYIIPNVAVNNDTSILLLAQANVLSAINAQSGAVVWNITLTGNIRNTFYSLIVDASNFVYVMVESVVSSNNAYAYYQIYSQDGKLVDQGPRRKTSNLTPTLVINAVGSLYYSYGEYNGVLTVSPAIVTRVANNLDCNAGYFDPQDDTSCQKCPYPHTNFKSNSLDCPNIWLRFSTPLQIVVLVTMSFVVLLSVVSGEHRVTLFFVVLMPTLDFFTDIAYLMTVKFETFNLFVASIAFVVVDAMVFGIDLYRNRHRFPVCVLMFPLITWPVFFAVRKVLSKSRTMDSLVRDPPKIDVSNLIGLIVQVLLYVCVTAWTLLIILLQGLVVVLSFLLLLVECALRFPFAAFWFLVGAVLHATKCLCIGRVWFWWIFVWGYPTVPHHLDTVEFDTRWYNEGRLMSLFCESFPQLVLQAVNNTMLGESWSPIAIASIAFSAFQSVDACYRIVFALCVAKVSFAHIPVQAPMAIRLMFGGDKLEPKEFELPRLLKSVFVSDNNEEEDDKREGLLKMLPG